MFSTQKIFHAFDFNQDVEKPRQFTFPFHYIPHIWVKQAAEEVQTYLKNQTEFDYQFGWDSESVGKMIGVLIVEDKNDKIGYLAAFSGKVNECNQLPGFVPPVFDVLNPDGFFKKGEENLNQINAEIERLQNSKSFKKLSEQLQNAKLNFESELKKLKIQHKKAKEKRKQVRAELEKFNPQKQEKLLLSLENESKKHHFEIKDFKRKQKEKIQSLEDDLIEFKKPIQTLKQKRKQFSADLQHKMHESFVFYNAKGDKKKLLDIFEPYGLIPPAGAGECAAPRLLQYAFLHSLKPLAMGEFWWGKSPNGIIRKQKNFYPACKAKCKPILTFMLEGLNVEENPIIQKIQDFDLEIIYEDNDLLVVNKPTGVLSVPGKDIDYSLQTKIKHRYPDNEMMLAHRLDMATSGLVLIAKSIEVYKGLQKQFTERTIKKTYTAVLDGVLNQKSGKIELPLRVDLENRPMQMVCYQHGKSASTYYKVVEEKENKTRVLFYPYTGRTHQLRVHAAHKDGLNMPILGDVLYGKSQDRLYLHATELIFEHPISKKIIKLNCKVPF